MELGDELEVGDQRTQLGGRAEVELGALVDVERLLEVVGLDAQVVGSGAALVQRQAVDQRPCRRSPPRAADDRRGRASSAAAGSLSWRSTSLTARCAGRSSDVSTVRSRRSSRYRSGRPSSARSSARIALAALRSTIRHGAAPAAPGHGIRVRSSAPPQPARARSRRPRAAGADGRRSACRAPRGRRPGTKTGGAAPAAGSTPACRRAPARRAPPARSPARAGWRRRSRGRCRTRPTARRRAR